MHGDAAQYRAGEPDGDAVCGGVRMEGAVSDVCVCCDGDPLLRSWHLEYQLPVYLGHSGGGGVFPAEDPRIAMVVIYEAPTSSIYGGSTAANVFRQIAEFIATEFRYTEPELRVAYVDK